MSRRKPNTRCATCAKLTTAPSKRSSGAIEPATTTPAISRTQFFAKLLEGNSLKGVERTRGRFRSYLLGAVKHFLSDQADRTLAEKRGSGQSPQSLDASPSHDRSERQEHTPLDVADPHGFPPDAFFDRQWALAIVEKAMSVLQAESQDRGETQRFEVLRRWLIPSEDGAIAAEAARSLDMTDGAFKVAVHRLRKRFRQLVKDQIASSVDGPEALQEELDYLIQALTASESSHDSSTCRPDALPAVDGISASP